MSSAFALRCLRSAPDGADLVAHAHYRELWAKATGQAVAACWLCGQASDASILVGDQIGESFTNHGFAQAPRSARLCAACAFFLMAHPASRHWWRNRSHLFCGSGCIHPTRATWRQILLDPPEPPFLACLAVSGQKNLIFRAPIAWQREGFGVQLEEERVIVTPALLAGALAPFEALLQAGVRRADILSGRANSALVLRLGLDVYRDLDRQLTRFRGSMLLELVAWIAQPKPQEDTWMQPHTPAQATA